jgi:hypothetical protein
VKGRQAQLFRVSHFNPAGIALTSFYYEIQFLSFIEIIWYENYASYSYMGESGSEHV